MDFKEIETKWQRWWEEHPELYHADDSSAGSEQAKPKKYVLVEFPYPSGSGLHIGHTFSFTGSDVYARFRRMQGDNVMFPMGWDAFGLPTENYAIKMKRKPQDVTKENTDNFRNQMKKLAFSFDWQREVNTTDPKYYKWTQWIFIKLFEKGLAYKQEMPINWCPSCKIGLANEEVIDGKCERCHTEVSRRNISQWVVKITDYADRLAEGLKDTAFIDKVKQAQVNWIGKSEGAKIKFQITKNNFQIKELEVFTTRPDTLYGATFMVISPEHKLVDELINNNEIKNYVEQSRKKSEMERTDLNKDKTGVFSGVYAINPVNKKEIPIWISDFVLASYGTGAIMSVPAHDERDFAFAKKFNLPIVKVIDFDDEMHVVVGKEFIDKRVFENIEGIYFEEKENQYWIVTSKEKAEDVKDMIQKSLTDDGFADVDGIYKGRITKSGLIDGWSFGINNYSFCYSKGQGTSINSEYWNGLSKEDAVKKSIEIIKEKGVGERSSSYHLRDWIFSRQHYWGEPIPMVDCPVCGWVPEKEENLPIKLPEVEAYEPTDDGLSPLSRISDFVNCTCPKCGGQAKRETDTMPNWAGSDWYFLRYCDPHSDVDLASQEKLKKWLPVDVYVGGDEHNTLHLLYSRFIHQFLYDIGAVPTPEPYYRRLSHGVILGPDSARMSKSKGNVIVPETVTDKYGVDVVRMYLMFMGPFDGTMAWNENTLMGVKRFLDRFNNFMEKQLGYDGDSDEQVKTIINRLAFEVARELGSFKFNTAVAKLMEALNQLTINNYQLSIEDSQSLLKTIAPLAPYTAEEHWHKMGNRDSVHQQLWLVVEEKYLVNDVVRLPVAVNGKVRDVLEVRDGDDVMEMAKRLPNIKKWLEGKTVVKEIYVPGKMVNLAVK